MIIRELGGADCAAYLALRAEGVRLYPDFMLMTAEELAAADKTKLAAQLDGGGMFGAFEGARLLGFAGIVQGRWAVISHRGEIGPFYVTPDFQGSGCADRLLEALLIWAREHGVSQVELAAAEANGRALAFYERQGFLRYGRLPNAAGPGQADIFLWRPVEPSQANR